MSPKRDHQKLSCISNSKDKLNFLELVQKWKHLHDVGFMDSSNFLAAQFGSKLKSMTSKSFWIISSNNFQTFYNSRSILKTKSIGMMQGCSGGVKIVGLLHAPT